MTSSPTPFSRHGWEIETLGENKYASAIEALQFVSEKDLILLDSSVRDSVASLPVSSGSIVSNLPPPTGALERAGPRKTLFFDPKTVVAGIVTCGGLCPALNNVVRAIVHTLLHRYGAARVIGFKYGYEGLNPSTSSILELTNHSVGDIHRFGGTILGSSRGPQPIDIMVDYLSSLGINILFTIGGDGTQRGAMSIAEEISRRGLNISVIGVPKTIDNDICYVERTFGFETAVALAQDPIMAAHEEARSARNGIGIVKLMGRESGFIALHAALASGEVNILLLPEMKFTLEGVVKAVVDRLKVRNHCVIVVSEGAGQDICKSGDLGKDASGNAKFADVGVFLKEQLGAKLKAMKMEHTIKYIDPSYTIRSAVATPSDAAFALRLGQLAAHAGMAGKTSMIVGMVNNQFAHLPMARACEYRKKVDVRGQEFQSFLDASGMDLALVGV